MAQPTFKQYQAAGFSRVFDKLSVFRTGIGFAWWRRHHVGKAGIFKLDAGTAFWHSNVIGSADG